MKKYLLREISKMLQNENDIFVGCTKGSENAFTKRVFENREEAISALRNNEHFRTARVVRNYFTKGCFEVTEFFVTLAEVGDHDNALERGMIIAYSDMPDQADEAYWSDNPEGF